MKWTLSWLKDYLKTDAGASIVADKLTQIGLEIESVTMPAVPIVAEIIDVTDIEGTHIHLLKVSDGKTVRQVVCGAPNVRKGLISVLALPGSVILGTEIRVGKIRGFESNGMLCSPKELGLGENHTGIIELERNKYKIGDPWGAAPLDAVFEASITPNRPDYLSVRGIARDLAAAGIGKLKSSSKSSNYETKTKGSESRKVIIKNKDRSPVYNFAEIHGIKIAPSNAEISKRLTAIGVNPKNAPVDATNYICYDIGQPLHCFDADEITGDIIVRLAKHGEKFTDLFDALHVLSEEDLVIADDFEILALAGIIGGKRGMTTDKTTNIILESAYFEPLGVRKTRHKLGLSTDASYRFERGVDPTISGEALDMAIKIIMKECGGTVVSYQVSPKQSLENELGYDPKLFNKKTGINLSAAKQKSILEKLGYTVSKDWKVTIPSWRFDVDIPEVLVGDIMRIYGYDNIAPIEIPSFAVPMQTAQTVSEFFANNRGLMEHYGYGFGNIDTEKMVSDKPNIKIANPIIDFMNTARNSLIPNMIETVSENIKRGYPDLAMFEIGTVFDGTEPLQEHKQLIIVRTGEASPRHWLKRNRPVDLFDVKDDLLAFLGNDVKTETENPPMWAHPYRYGRLVRDGKILGEFGDLHPRLVKHWRIKVPFVIGLIEKLEAKDSQSKNSNRGLVITDFQPITRDFSFVLNKEIPADVIIAAARGADSQIVDVREFDFFENSENRERSIAFTITILPDHNLSDTELQTIQNKVITEVEKLGAKIRDK